MSPFEFVTGLFVSRRLSHTTNLVPITTILGMHPTPVQRHFPASREAENYQPPPTMDLSESNTTAPDRYLLPKTKRKPRRSLPMNTNSRKSGATTFIRDGWFWELLCLLASAGVLLGILRICGHYNGKPQPNWNSISLNTAIAWLSALSKLLLLTPLEVFDSGSRGVVGSILVLLKTKGL